MSDGRPGKWPKPPSGLRQRRAQSAPLRDRLADLRIVAAELAEDEHGVEAGVDVPVGLLDVPAAVGLLVAEHAGDHPVGLRRGLADQAIEVGHVERRGDMVAEVAVGGLVRLHVAGELAPPLLGERACRAPRRGAGRSSSCTRGASCSRRPPASGRRRGEGSTSGSRPERPQADDALRRVVEDAQVAGRVVLPCEVDEPAVGPLVPGDELDGPLRAPATPSPSFWPARPRRSRPPGR